MEGEAIGRTRRAGSAPHESELRFRRLLEKLPAGAYTCDPEGLITYFNQHAVQLWGRAPKLNDPVDRFCGSFRLFSPNGSPIAHDRCWMARSLEADEGYNGREIVVERPDGGRLTALAHANPIHDGSGKLIGAVNVLVDITERKRAEEELERRVAERTKELAVATASCDAASPNGEPCSAGWSTRPPTTASPIFRTGRRSMRTSGVPWPA